MIKIKDINYGYYPSAQLCGMKCLHFLFEESKEKVPETNEEIKKAIDKLFLEDIKNLLDEKKLENEWVDFMTAKTYGIFSGNCLPDPKNARIIQNFLAYIGHISHEMQKEESVEFRKRPPMMCFYGEPVHFTGNEQFYENFNIVIIECDPVKVPPAFALIEMQNHNFANLQAKCKTVEDVKAFVKNYTSENFITLPKERQSIINIGNQAVTEEAFKHGFRVFLPLKGNCVLKSF